MTDGALYSAAGRSPTSIGRASTPQGRSRFDPRRGASSSNTIARLCRLSQARVSRRARSTIARSSIGAEEIQHGLALALGGACRSELRFEDSFARFRALYRPVHFERGNASVRGSKRGEMIARCVVESGTSSFYSAIRDSTEEPVLKEVASRIAGDEYRHYRLFYDILQAQTEPDLPVWRKVWVAMGRVTEADDDELACAYYCANVPAADAQSRPYRRDVYNRAYNAKAMTLYRRHHIDKLVKMVALPAGINPTGRLSGLASAALWHV
jgi:hypothetical protein